MLYHIHKSMKYLHGFIDFAQETGKLNAFLLAKLQRIIQIFLEDNSFLLLVEAEKFALQILTVQLIDG